MSRKYLPAVLLVASFRMRASHYLRQFLPGNYSPRASVLPCLSGSHGERGSFPGGGMRVHFAVSGTGACQLSNQPPNGCSNGWPFGIYPRKRILVPLLCRVLVDCCHGARGYTVCIVASSALVTWSAPSHIVSSHRKSRVKPPSLGSLQMRSSMSVRLDPFPPFVVLNSTVNNWAMFLAEGFLS